MRKTALVVAAFLSLLFASDAALASLSIAPPEAAAVAAPQAEPDANAEQRQDYESAERVGTKPAWESFLQTHPTGFYADLARTQLSRLDAGQPDTSTAEKTKAANEETARLARETASKADTDANVALKAKHDADAAKAREQARIAAAERRKREGARIASLNAQGAGSIAQPAREAKAAPRMDRAALFAKCDATLSRGNRDDDITRPGRVEACVRDGGPR